ncbi:MAG: hypothetical protein IIW54_00755 [Lachnospiraceae bacterium]|nr:hypothetical protein [Lachnospiraceae bacterium]
MAKLLKRRLKKRFFVFLTLVILLTGSLVYFLIPKGYVTISNGDIGYKDSFKAVIIRNETVHSEQNFGKIIMNVNEGKQVAKDTKLAEIYEWDYGDRITDELIDIQTQISKVQEENIVKNIINQDLEQIRKNISQKVEQIKQVVKGNSNTDMLVLENELKELKKQEQTLIKSLDTTNNSTLKTLYEQEQVIVDRINKSKTDILADKAGVVSFYFDGAEDTLTYANLGNLTKDNIQDIINGKLPTTNNTDGTKKVYRLIDNFKWYAAVLGPENGIKEMVIDQSFQVSFDGIYDKPYSGKLVMAKKLDGAMMYVFEFEEDVTPLIST